MERYAQHYGLRFILMSQYGDKRLMRYVDCFGVKYERWDTVKNNFVLNGSMRRCKVKQMVLSLR